MGLRDPLVVRREESEARAKAAPPHKVVTGRPRAPVGELVYFDKELILLFFSPLILLLSPVGFLFEGFEGLAITELYLPLHPSLSTALSSFDRVARFSRAFACVRACTQVEVELYCRVRRIHIHHHTDRPILTFLSVLYKKKAVYGTCMIYGDDL